MVAWQHISSSGTPLTPVVVDHPDFKSSSKYLTLSGCEPFRRLQTGSVNSSHHQMSRAEQRVLKRQRSSQNHAAVLSFLCAFRGLSLSPHLLCISFISPAMFTVLFPAYQLRSCSLASPSHYPHLCSSTSLHLHLIILVCI